PPGPVQPGPFPPGPFPPGPVPAGLGQPGPMQPPGYPVSGPPGYPVSGPGYPVSGGGFPVSGAYPPGPYLPGPYPPGVAVPPPARSSGGRRALIVGVIVLAVLAACGAGVFALNTFGGKPKHTSSTVTGGTPGTSPSPSATPVTATAYQQALTALDTAVAPGFQQLLAARTPSAVADAVGSIGTTLTAQVQVLGGLMPPDAVSSAHTTFVTALSSLAGDVQSAAAAAGSRQLCGGSSALATISESPGADQARTAAAALATADAANPYKVGAWLPASTAQQSRRLGNGNYVKAPGKRGLGRLKITNSGSVDAAISIAPASGGNSVLTVYVRAKGTFTATHIVDGTYNIFVTTGSDWDTGAKAFTRDCDFSKFDTPATYRTTSSTYTQYSITLTPVSGGNATTSGVDPNQFPS
ncbi:MAG TPA: hypothetical protein VJT31_02290, partial [Rugosimonospora sp.]|nr:hypothetical protein [Rugosimonospora sp.]